MTLAELDVTLACNTLSPEPRSLTIRVSVLTTTLQDAPQHRVGWRCLTFSSFPLSSPMPLATNVLHHAWYYLQVLQQQRFYTQITRFRKERRRQIYHPPLPDLRCPQTPHASHYKYIAYWKRPMTHQWGKRDLRPGKRARTTWVV